MPFQPPSASSVALGLVAGYVAATLSESLLHNHFGHATASFRALWKRMGWISRGFAFTFYGHAVIHHGRTFRVDYVTQFKDEAEKRAVDEDLERRGWAALGEEAYGLTIGPRDFVNFLLLPLLTLPLIQLVGGPWATLSALVPILSTPLLSRYVHPYLHMRYDEAVRFAPAPIRLLIRTAYFRRVARHHYVHHRYPSCNFNLLLGGDWLLGVHRSPTLDDLQKMNALGLLRPLHLADGRDVSAQRRCRSERAP
jgi:hypothetical protein